MCPILRHVALKIAINIVGVVAGDAARLLLVCEILARHQRLRAFCRLVLRAILWRILRALFVIRVATVHAPDAVPNRPPKQISAQVAVGWGRVGVLLEAMWMGEAFLVPCQVTASENVHCGAKRINFSI